MLRDITIGQYYPTSSVIHKMDPRTKILFALFFMVMIFLLSEGITFALMGVLTALIVPDYDQAKQEGINDETLTKMMDDNLKTLNTQVAAYEKVARYEIMKSEFEKTPKRSTR